MQPLMPFICCMEVFMGGKAPMPVMPGLMHCPPMPMAPMPPMEEGKSMLGGSRCW